MPIADSSAPIVVGISDTSSAISVVTDTSVLRELGERPQGHDHRQEHEREAREQDVERDLVRRLAAVGALDERDHAVQEAVPRLLGDLDHDPVRQHARAAGDRAAVAAGLADHRRRLARDRGLVDRRDALDHGAVAGISSPASTTTTSPRRSSDARLVVPSRRRATVSVRIARSASGLRAPAALRERLGQVREHDRQPQPDRDGEREPGRLVPAAQRLHRRRPGSARRPS